jgi:hypothetical protein
MSCKQDSKGKNHGTQDSRVVPHRGTNWAALRLTAQIERDAVFSKSYGRGYETTWGTAYKALLICAFSDAQQFPENINAL